MENETITYAELITNAEGLFGKGNYTEALLDANDAIEMKGDDAWAYYLRASIKNHLNDMDGAKEDWERSIQLGGDTIKYLAKLTEVEKYRFE